MAAWLLLLKTFLKMEKNITSDIKWDFELLQISWSEQTIQFSNFIQGVGFKNSFHQFKWNVTLWHSFSFEQRKFLKYDVQVSRKPGWAYEHISKVYAASFVRSSLWEVFFSSSNLLVNQFFDFFFLKISEWLNTFIR